MYREYDDTSVALRVQSVIRFFESHFTDATIALLLASRLFWLRWRRLPS